MTQSTIGEQRIRREAVGEQDSKQYLSLENQKRKGSNCSIVISFNCGGGSPDTKYCYIERLRE